MPFIDYKCKNEECNHEFNVFYTSQSAKDREEAEEKCPKCGSTEKEQQISRETSFVLKGGGWFKQGY
jgi:putative FmdB family regulatory protein